MIVPCGIRKRSSVFPSFSRHHKPVAILLQWIFAKISFAKIYESSAIILYHRHWKQLLLTSPHTKTYIQSNPTTIDRSIMVRDTTPCISLSWDMISFFHGRGSSSAGVVCFMWLVHRRLVPWLTIFKWVNGCLGTPDFTLSGLSCARSRYTFRVGIHNGILPKVRPHLDLRSRPRTPFTLHMCLGPGLQYPHPPSSGFASPRTEIGGSASIPIEDTQLSAVEWLVHPGSQQP